MTLSILPLHYSPAAHAGILDLFGGGRGSGNASGRRSGGAVRDECPVNGADVALLQALVPNNNKVVTHATHPTFWFYVPFAQSESLRYAELMLIDADNRTYALEQPILFDLPEQPGIVQVRLPEYATGLERDRSYRWYFSIQCDPNELSRNPVLSGEIERSPQANVETLWPEAMISVMGDRSSNDWPALLEAFTLEDLAQDPIVEMRPVTSSRSTAQN